MTLSLSFLCLTMSIWIDFQGRFCILFMCNPYTKKKSQTKKLSTLIFVFYLRVFLCGCLFLNECLKWHVLCTYFISILLVFRFYCFLSIWWYLRIGIWKFLWVSDKTYEMKVLTQKLMTVLFTFCCKVRWYTYTTMRVIFWSQFTKKIF